VGGGAIPNDAKESLVIYKSLVVVVGCRTKWLYQQLPSTPPLWFSSMGSEIQVRLLLLYTKYRLYYRYVSKSGRFFLLKSRKHIPHVHNGSVADPDPGSGAFLTPVPGSGIRNSFFPDPRSRILTPYFLELNDKFLGKKFYNSLKTGPNFFLKH
jgi:hypothetical protein